jgi:peptidoglycan/LPS O-acetylase OafA/YrhL
MSDKPSNRIPSLDGLRALSIAAVIMAHSANHFTTSFVHVRPLQYAFAILSYFGVTVFFVISGFLITTLLQREYLKTSRIDLGGFYRRRAARILPASLFYIAVILILGHPTWIQSLYALTFTTTYFSGEAYKPLQHLWSLSVEEQFYLLWPLVFATGIKNARRYCWVILAVSPVVRLVLYRSGYAEFFHCAPAIADSIGAGCLLAFYQDQVRNFVRKYFMSTVSFVALGTATVLAAGELYRIHLVLLWGAVPCLIALIVAAAIERKGSFLNSAPVVWVGLLSYSLYLWQQPFLAFDGPLNFLSVRLLLTFVMAYVSYRLVEQPMLRLRSRKPTATPVKAPAPDAA